MREKPDLNVHTRYPKPEFDMIVIPAF